MPEPKEFDLNRVPGFREALNKHVQRIYDQMAESPDGDEWRVVITLPFRRDSETVRAKMLVKPPRPEAWSWTAKPTPIGR